MIAFRMNEQCSFQEFDAAINKVFLTEFPSLRQFLIVPTSLP
jgi:hypothetical protein